MWVNAATGGHQRISLNKFSASNQTYSKKRAWMQASGSFDVPIAVIDSLDRRQILQLFGVSLRLHSGIAFACKSFNHWKQKTRKQIKQKQQDKKLATKWFADWMFLRIKVKWNKSSISALAVYKWLQRRAALILINESWQSGRNIALCVKTDDLVWCLIFEF